MPGPLFLFRRTLPPLRFEEGRGKVDIFPAFTRRVDAAKIGVGPLPVAEQVRARSPMKVFSRHPEDIMLKRIAVLVFSVALVSLLGCEMGQLRLTVQFDATEGLSVDDPVLFEQNRIGTVQNVRYTSEGKYHVGIAVKKEFKNALTVDSLFYIDGDPARPGAKALVVEQPQAGGALLPDKALVMGSKRASTWRQIMETLQQKAGEWEEELNRTFDDLKREYQDKSTEMDRDLDAAIKEMTRKLEELQEAIRKSADSEEIKALRQAAEELLMDLQKSLGELGVQEEGALPEAAPEGAPNR